MSVWLIALDQTILAPALPVIASQVGRGKPSPNQLSLIALSSQYNALDQLAWIASAYFLTQTAFLLLYGQVLTVFDRKWTFIFAIAAFEVGSIICAAAPTVNVLIFGRAFAGVGAAGSVLLYLRKDVPKLVLTLPTPRPLPAPCAPASPHSTRLASFHPLRLAQHLRRGSLHHCRRDSPRAASQASR